MNSSAATVSSKVRLSIKMQLILFFVLSFALAWLAWIPAMINPKIPQPLSLIGLYAPAISALIVAWWAQGRVGIIAILKRYTVWRFSFVWYLFAFLLMFVIYTIALIGTVLTSRSSSLNQLLLANTPLFVLFAFFYLLVINSGEEIGWRGFALPLLQAGRLGTVGAGLVLGVIWALWHYPLYANPDVATMPFPLFVVFLIGLSIVYTHLFHLSKGSIWTVLVLHASTDLAPRILNFQRTGVYFWIAVVFLVWVVAIIMTFVYQLASREKRE